MHVAIRQASSIVTVSHSARRDLLRLHGVAAGSRGGGSRGRQPGVPADRRSRAARGHAGALRPAAAIHPLRRHDRAAQEPDATDDGVRRTRARPAFRIIWCASGPTDGRRAISPGISSGSAFATSCISPATCRSRTCRRSTTSASFFVFPSLYEGFGLPVVEAMACGMPVLTSNTSSLGEIAGDAAETIDPTSTDAIADAIVRLATDAGAAARSVPSAGCSARAASRGRKPRATCWRCITAPPASTVTVAGASSLAQPSRRSARAGEVDVAEPAVMTDRARSRSIAWRPTYDALAVGRDVSASAPADARRVRAMDSIRIPRARDRLRHRRRHGVPGGARRARRRVRSVGGNVEPHQAAPREGRPRRSRRHSVVRPAGSAAVSRRARSCRRLRRASSRISARSIASPSLAPLGVIGRRHLRAGGAMVIGLMGRTCLWETLYFTARGDRRDRRRRRRRRERRRAGGRHRRADVLSPHPRRRGVARRAASRSDAVIGIGVLVPPPYLEPRWQQVPSALRRAAAGVDRWSRLVAARQSARRSHADALGETAGDHG